MNVRKHDRRNELIKISKWQGKLSIKETNCIFYCAFPFHSRLDLLKVGRLKGHQLTIWHEPNSQILVFLLSHSLLASCFVSARLLRGFFFYFYSLQLFTLVFPNVFLSYSEWSTLSSLAGSRSWWGTSGISWSRSWTLSGILCHQ